ncbi:6PGD fold domain-containing protein [Corynebacterium guangdongense]|uniref:Short-subunit dehydrogenase-like oxidoreductase (DUF2520 family) n=1 Tax=Corynebacterium guangdongense TaxID=1783348 RepID=A0ABU2A2I2_9CORY|nr:hypothetical protein [Corynebacterium guangdongense]MDR7330303.1 putative short-subunit dehydrogenase-like oxidoreductase (DUF2520 family) [Corynebacterium guangdongense]WJZ18861.1 Rossmann-like domain protein [Corynebacterium guangdongense]
MQAPRLRAAVLVDASGSDVIVQQLQAVGHHVTVLDGVADVESAADHELVVLAVGENCLPDLVEMLAARARRGQIYLHTSLGHGIQVMDPLETTGAVVIAAHQLGERVWATAAADELGETIVGLLVGEFGGNAVAVTETQRARLAAARTYAGFLEHIRRDARNLYLEALGNLDYAEDLVEEQSTPARLADVDGPGGIAAQHAAIDDPGVARTYRELVRRTAELTRADDVELWAIQQE